MKEDENFDFKGIDLKLPDDKKPLEFKVKNNKSFMEHINENIYNDKYKLDLKSNSCAVGTKVESYSR
jgi:hypothetical protein